MNLFASHESSPPPAVFLPDRGPPWHGHTGTQPAVLVGLQKRPFELLDSVKLKFLLAKTALLTALTSIKRVGTSKRFR